MTIYVAFYKGRKGGQGIKVQLARLTDWAIRQATGGIYSHCEIAIATPEGRFECYSASLRDGGVRRKVMPLPPHKWDLVQVSDGLIDPTRTLYRHSVGEPYDLIGALAVALPRCIATPRLGRWFCSEWCGQALGLNQPEKYSPNALAKYSRSSHVSS